jgi:hypothetical protein
MAIHYAGGTDRIRWGVPGTTVTIGCIAFWFKTSQATNNACIATPNRITVAGFASTSTVLVGLTTTTNVNDGNWHHLAYNWNGNNGGSNQLYIDGVLQASGNSSAAWPGLQNTGAGIYTGDNVDTFWATYVGDLAELAIWCNRQLDADEIAALAKRISPITINMAPASQRYYMPLIRDGNNVFDSFVSAVGALASDHPSMIGR